MSRYNQGTLIVSSSPHILDNINTTRIMLDVIIALVPAFIMSGVVFGPRAILLTITCVASCVVFEWAFEKVTKKENTITDLSAVVTGILLGFNLPSSLPYWMAVIGSFVAIVVVKQLFGGIGQNFANPAITARIVLMLSFATPMTTWPLPKQILEASDAVTGPTPLGIMNMGGNISQLPSKIDMFLGFTGGCLGETSAIALLIGGLYLIGRKVIEPTIPVVYIGTVFIIALIAGQDPVFHVLAGGLMLGAFFMATDYATSPLTTKGKIVYAIGCGILTMIIRLFGALPEGVSFSILLMNILTPHIDNLSRRKIYGGGGKK
ncbi:MAG TPA: RnfABCDGE type electron transport complex subunit D [Bacillota bacterium]|nr:RnfABCDGE type electron transport complex subunit D [Bacillota bacterium]